MHVMSDGCNKTRKLFQFSRQPHWTSGSDVRALVQVDDTLHPLAMRLYQFYLYPMMEKNFLGFYQGTGGSIREDLNESR